MQTTSHTDVQRGADRQPVVKTYRDTGGQIDMHKDIQKDR
jgi:hypothetical protein